MSKKKWISVCVKWNSAIVLSLLLAICLNVFLIQPYIVNGSSMQPTLDGEDQTNAEKVGDRVIVFKSAYLFGNSPNYGDMVIIDSRSDIVRSVRDKFLDSPLLAFMDNRDDIKGNIWIKRVIGEPGDLLEIVDGVVYRNGSQLEEEYIKEEMNEDYESFVVPDGHVFVMGDNRNNSSDSREIGPVPIENVVGRVFLRFYPFDRINTL